MEHNNKAFKRTILLVPIFLCVNGNATDQMEENYHDINHEANKTNEGYYFDSNAFQGNGLEKSVIEKFNKNIELEPGRYLVDIYLNDKFIESKSIDFIKKENKVIPCIDSSFIKKSKIILNADVYNNIDDSSCINLESVINGAVVFFDQRKLKLNITVPQTSVVRTPRGYVDPKDLDSGSNVAYINYAGNYYYTESNGYQKNKYDSAFFNLNAGINFGKWQYRQQSNISTDSDGDMKFDNVRSYIQRPITDINAKLTLGQQYTSGKFFSGLEFNGLNLSTDERMRPESLRGYAPTIRGVAQSNAKVSVRQNDRVIYQITVPPGPFEINDLYPTNYEGNLTVVILEANGTERSMEIPYAAVPNSLREGTSNYSFSMGRTNVDTGMNSYFTDINYEYGVNNALTLNSAMRLAEGYQSVAVGNVVGSKYGAIGTNIAYSRAKMPLDDDDDYISGWMADISYSKTFDVTDTTLALAGYRYSDSGYRDLIDVLGIRKSYEDNLFYNSYDYLQRSRLQISLSQPLGEYGSFYVTGSTQDYRDERDRDTTLQVGYNKAFKNLTMNLSYTRQKVHTIDGGVIKEDGFENFGGLTFSIPLGNTSNPKTPNLNASYTNNGNNDNYQVGVSGALDDDYSLNYNLGVSGSTSDGNAVYNAGIYKNFSNGQLGLNTAYSDQYKQASVNASGAVALHSGGVTFGPYVGETFAIIEAKGAKGASISSAPTSKIDRFGYAILPSLSPYRYNKVGLDPQGISNNIEIEGGEQRVAPVAGAAVRITFNTRKGYSVLFDIQMPNDMSLPIGTDIVDEDGQIVGMVGQNGQAFVRVAQEEGRLFINTAEVGTKQCEVPYKLKTEELQQPLINRQATCAIGI